MPYPTELIPTANLVQSYMGAPSEAADAFAEAQMKASPVDRIVGAFDALKGHLAILDVEGAELLAACAEQIVVNGFHGKSAEALPIRDAAIAALL
jgi:hypothetical protein